MDVGMVVNIITGIRIFIETMKEITFQGVIWNTSEVMKALAQFIADAPKLQKVDIYDRTSRPRILLRRKKAEQDDTGFVTEKGFVTINDLETNQV